MIDNTQALAYMLPGLCAHCGAKLPSPGTPCDACGRIPEITAPEAEQLLNSATALAAVEQKVLETEAEALYQAAMAKWAEASQVLHVALLQDQRDAAQKAVDEHKRAHKRLLAPLARAEKAEDAAAAELTQVVTRYDEAVAAEKLARKMHHGYDAEKQAKRDLEDATEIRDRYQGHLAGATTRRVEAENPVTASKARGDQLQKALADAKAAFADPGPAPILSAAVIASPFRLLKDGKLDGDGAALEVAGEAGRAICDLAGRTQDIVTDARRELLAEQEAGARGKALHLRNTPNGVVATPNPFNANAPQPYHPAQFPQGPVQPATTPGW